MPCWCLWGNLTMYLYIYIIIILNLWKRYIYNFESMEMIYIYIISRDSKLFTSLSYVHTFAERRRADFDIPAPLPRVCSHISGANAWGSAISWGQWWFGARGFEAGAVNWVLGPFLAERFLLPLRLRSATAHVWTRVMICVEANFPPASARACVNVSFWVLGTMIHMGATEHWDWVPSLMHLFMGNLKIRPQDEGC